MPIPPLREEADVYEEIVIGFDTRIDLSEVGSAWDAQRRRRFLLRDDAATVPLSADEAVWPRSVPLLSDGVDGAMIEILTPRFASVEDATANVGPGEVVIGLTAWRGPGEPELPAGPAWPMRPDHHLVWPEWERLGWDVVSGVFPSALSNCGWSEDTRDDWSATWAGELNAHHLFDTLPSAFAFRDASNRRVAEHAPFSVLGLYLRR